jgi:hypothetical protein
MLGTLYFTYRGSAISKRKFYGFAEPLTYPIGDGAFLPTVNNYCLSLLLLVGGGQTPQSTQIFCIISSPGTS